MKFHTVTVHTPADLESVVNEAAENGLEITVNGKIVLTGDVLSPKPAVLWGTGSVSVDVATKSGKGKNLLWMKPSSPAFTVTLSIPAAA